MKPEAPRDIYEVWLDRRRQDFSHADLSCLVMASVRSISPLKETRFPFSASRLGAPSALLGLGRLIFFAILILTPA